MKNDTSSEEYKNELEDFILDLFLILNKNIVIKKSIIKYFSIKFKYKRKQKLRM